MKVLKFGGSSVATPDRIHKVIDILKGYYTRGEKFTVVFSAFGGVTDSLIQMSDKAASGDESYLHDFDTFRERHLEAAEALLQNKALKQVKPEFDENHEDLKSLLSGIFLVREVSPRTRDYVLSFGERNAAFLITHALRRAGIRAQYLDARKVVRTDKRFGHATVLLEETFREIADHYDLSPEVQVVTGFIGSTNSGLTTTLGRGGSDYTAALLAAALKAELLEIWTDVDGVLTADPRRVRKAFTVPRMTYQEAMEMSHFGAKVIYPPTIQPAASRGIPLVIRNTFRPEFPGTYISAEGDPDTRRAVKGISSISDLALLTLQGSGLFGVPGTAGRLFSSLAREGINVILITQGSSEHSISFALRPEVARQAVACLEKEFEYELRLNQIDPVKVEKDLSIVAVIGENMRYRPGISGRLFQSMGQNGVNVVAIAQGSSERNISVVVRREDEAKALNVLHEAFFLSDTKALHLYMVGVGLIGSTLLRQIQEHQEYLRAERQLELKVVGLANSKKMIFAEEGIDLEKWKENLLAAETDMSLPAFVEKMKSLNLSNAIFVDNTASDTVPGFYEHILDASIAISTPNKLAASSSLGLYQRLRAIASRRGVPFRYETNVGAGLPVLTTLHDLISSGDRILKIQGVLSGSLSFIFNQFGEGTSFSRIVQQAREGGLTEPDPREDLSAGDIARKITILAREAGYEMEREEVEVASILPPSCEAAESVDDFMQALAAADGHFEQIRAVAAEKGGRLRMIATLEDGSARIALEEVGPESPFYPLSGSDNMIVFTTDRYRDRPLVIRGPGAGAEVTAAGLFAEIIGIGSGFVG